MAAHPRPAPDVVAVIAAGGALGGLARHAVSVAVPTAHDGLPWATLAANVSGSLLLGVLMVVLLERSRPRRYLRPFLGVGVLGGYTTFSTYAVEAVVLLDQGRVAAAAAYVVGTLMACLLATWCGMVAARSLLGRRT